MHEFIVCSFLYGTGGIILIIVMAMSVHLCGGDGDAGDLDIFYMTPFMRLMKYGYPLSSFSIILFMNAGAMHLKNCCFASHSDNLAMKTWDPISNITSHLRSFNFFSNCCELLHCMHGSYLLAPTHIQVYAHTDNLAVVV